MPLKTKTIIEIGKAIAGLDPEAKERMRARLKVCVACPSGAYRAGFCGRLKGGCGCNLWLKTQAKSESCPLGHW
jgi:hypothetical protein